MPDSNPNPLPDGVRAIVVLFALCALYLGTLGAVMLLRPGLVAMSAGAPLLFGLELAGPYMFLLAALTAAAIALGLIRRVNLARHAATLTAVAGIAMLVPFVSGAVIMVNVRALTTGGLGIIIRVMIAWYLSQAHIADEFRRLP